ncbi:MAG TPA: histidine--tRNA ligase, partial [Bacteroidetes bacterium]|nr:histidine--tRNA ligase [Bacteroidota bacterium]
MTLQFQTPRGTKDILPGEMPKWHYLEHVLRDIFTKYNFREIRTPVFEDTDLFARGIGGTTDIVQKEMYTFLDKGGKSYTLRPEMTAPVVRAYLQHHLGQTKALQKMYYIAPMFRQERPQAGRFRQFHQYGVEIMGTQAPLADVEIITVGVEFLRRLGLKDIHLKLNSVGCLVCRPVYKLELQNQLRPVLEQLCGDCRNRFHTNPLRILDCKKENCRALTEEVDPIDNYLCDECKSHFGEVKALLTEVKIPFEPDKRLVRGLDYYTKTAFEIITDQLGSQDAICGGGRYDMLAKEIGGDAVPGVGFAAGLERLITVMDKAGLFPETDPHLDLYLIGLGDAARSWVYRTAMQLRRNNLICEIDYQQRSLKAQMREANRLNAGFTAIVGENELKNGSIPLKK